MAFACFFYTVCRDVAVGMALYSEGQQHVAADVGFQVVVALAVSNSNSLLAFSLAAGTRKLKSPTPTLERVPMVLCTRPVIATLTRL